MQVAKDSDDAPEIRGRVVSIFGPFGSRALIEVSSETARNLLDAGEIEPCGRGVIDAIDGELAELRGRSPVLAASALAAALRVLAYELENPYNSLTSKAAATKELREGSDRLRELAPPARERTRLDQLREDREQRLAAGSATA